MSKNKMSSSELFKKASAFEKLALYSDRKSFLKSLSQAADRFTEEEQHQWDNTDELGNKKNYVSYPPVPKADTSGTQFTNEEHQQWENTDELGNPKQTGIPAVPSATAPAAQSPAKQADPLSSKMWATRLIDTVNTYIDKAGPQNTVNLMDPKREQLAKQLDQHAIAELVRLYNKLGGSDNPYTTPESKALAEKIKATVAHFGQTFSAQVPSLTHYNQLQT